MINMINYQQLVKSLRQNFADAQGDIFAFRQLHNLLKAYTIDATSQMLYLEEQQKAERQRKIQAEIEAVQAKIRVREAYIADTNQAIQQKAYANEAERLLLVDVNHYITRSMESLKNILSDLTDDDSDRLPDEPFEADDSEDYEDS